MILLLQFCSFDPHLADAMTTLSRFGYSHSPISVKLALLKSLCEKQFDYNLKFKELVSQTNQKEIPQLSSTLPTNQLRLAPIGSDRRGQVYWFQLDSDVNLRVYAEEPDDLSGATWTLKVADRAQLAALIDSLTRDSTGKSKEENGTKIGDEVKPSEISEGNGVENPSQPPPPLVHATSTATIIDLFQAAVPEIVRKHQFLKQN